MPELPEVETVARSLKEFCLNATIKRVEIFSPDVLGSSDLAERIAGRKIISVGRRGKYLLFGLDDDLYLVVHLRMTGRLLYLEEGAGWPKHTHACFYLDKGTLVFADTRRFGRLWLAPKNCLTEVGGLASLGPEPLDKSFGVDSWRCQTAKRKRSTIKALLLDQHVVAGLGNIYADEVLFAAGIHPQRRLADLTEAEEKALCLAMRKILKAAIANRGTTFRDYVDGQNKTGNYQNFLKVFQREGQPCPRCGGEIKRIKVAGRSSFYCPNCQKI